MPNSRFLSTIIFIRLGHFACTVHHTLPYCVITLPRDITDNLVNILVQPRLLVCLVCSCGVVWCGEPARTCRGVGWYRRRRVAWVGDIRAPSFCTITRCRAVHAWCAHFPLSPTGAVYRCSHGSVARCKPLLFWWCCTYIPKMIVTIAVGVCISSSCKTHVWAQRLCDGRLGRGRWPSSKNQAEGCHHQRA